MALIRDQFCHICNKLTEHVNSYCAVCMREDKRKRIDKWNAMTVDERLNDLRERVENLERSSAIY